jgi:hypothetical protein
LIRDRSVVIKMHKIAKCLHIPHFLIKLPDKIKKKKKKNRNQNKAKIICTARENKKIISATKQKLCKFYVFMYNVNIIKFI